MMRLKQSTIERGLVSPTMTQSPTEVLHTAYQACQGASYDDAQSIARNVQHALSSRKSAERQMIDEICKDFVGSPGNEHDVQEFRSMIQRSGVEETATCPVATPFSNLVALKWAHTSSEKMALLVASVRLKNNPALAQLHSCLDEDWKSRHERIKRSSLQALDVHTHSEDCFEHDICLCSARGKSILLFEAWLLRAVRPWFPKGLQRDRLKEGWFVLLLQGTVDEAAEPADPSDLFAPSDLEEECQV